MPILTAACLYFAAVFGAGFVLGPIRVLLLEPRVGPVAAVLCEAPLLLAAMVLAARWAPRVAGVETRRASLLLIGLGALVLQQAADIGVGLWLRGIGIADQLARLATVEGRIYLLLLVLFVLMPVLVHRRG
jgi:hypothetical protein